MKIDVRYFSCCSGAGEVSVSSWVLKELTLLTVFGHYGPLSIPTAAEHVVEGCSTEKEDVTRLGKYGKTFVFVTTKAQFMFVKSIFDRF